MRALETSAAFWGDACAVVVDPGAVGVLGSVDAAAVDVAMALGSRVSCAVLWLLHDASSNAAATASIAFNVVRNPPSTMPTDTLAA